MKDYGARFFRKVGRFLSTDTLAAGSVPCFAGLLVAGLWGKAAMIGVMTVLAVAGVLHQSARWQAWWQHRPNVKTMAVDLLVAAEVLLVVFIAAYAGTRSNLAVAAGILIAGSIVTASVMVWHVRSRI